MNSLNKIIEGIELDIKDFEKELRDKGYTKEKIRGLLPEFSTETVDLIKDNPKKMAEIIEKLLQESGDEDDGENYRKKIDELNEEQGLGEESEVFRRFLVKSKNKQL